MAEGRPLGSVIIPAWNEEAVIDRTLDALFDGIEPDQLEVLVACNGCTDDTVKVVRRYGTAATVLDLPPVGKSGAIRAAEAMARSLPRLYLDADVTLPGRSAAAVLTALRDGAVAARPPLQYETSGASTVVRRFYRQRMRLPAIQADLCGAGVYGLSARARDRFGEFPEVTADDLFAARLVETHEVMIVSCEPVIVSVPRDVRSLVHMLARVYRGNREFAESMPSSTASTTRSTFTQLVRSLSSPSDVVDAIVYASVVLAGRALASRPRGGGWERDESSRKGPEMRTKS